MATLKLVDWPMGCCGMVEASGFQVSDVRKEGRWTRSTPEDVKPLFDEIEEHQLAFRRNCAMLTLSDTQRVARAAAEQNGYKLVFEFYNPNSAHKVGIFVKALYENYHDFEQAQLSGKQPPVEINLYCNKQEPKKIEFADLY